MFIPSEILVYLRLRLNLNWKEKLENDIRRREGQSENDVIMGVCQDVTD